jgi:RimJ/RimL family protein N-acetyltransferase
VVRVPGRPPLGYVQATVLDNGSAWVAYLLGSAHQGRGHATRATAAMLTHLESEHGTSRLLANVEVENLPSIRLLQRLGFRAATACRCRASRADRERAHLRA